MSRLAQTFADLKSKGERALVLFVTAGDPSLDELPAILGALTEGGADVLEVGIPFSDPIADGPTIQASSQRALDRGTRVCAVFDALKGFQGPPIVLMGYMNTILRHGFGHFANLAAASGADATIVCDLTPDEAGEWIAASKDKSLDNVFLTAPNSTDDRLDEVCRRSTGFVYALSRTGVTGQRDDMSGEARSLVERLRQRTETPVCVGFGVSSPAHVREVCQFADGAIIGSWLVDRLARDWNGGQGRDGIVAAVTELKAATRP